MYMECDNTDPLESDSDSNCDLPSCVALKVLKMTTKLLVLHVGPRFIY